MFIIAYFIYIFINDISILNFVFLLTIKFFAIKFIYTADCII